jgi:hypothetical protein
MILFTSFQSLLLASLEFEIQPKLIKYLADTVRDGLRILNIYAEG